MASDKRVKVTLACSECKQRNYNTMKNKKNDPDRLEMNKYCRFCFCKKHTSHKETRYGKKELSSMANTEKKNIFQRIGGFFVRLVKGIGRKFKEMFFELKKVTWPTKKDMINYSIVVLVFIVIMGVIIGVIDLGAGKLVELLVS